jgi:hypothetical protein
MQRTRGKLAFVAAVFAAVAWLPAAAGGHTFPNSRPTTLCTTDGGGMTAMFFAFRPAMGTPIVGGCGTYDWQVSPPYDGTYYSDATSADAAEPPPPAPVTPSIPTWRNLYDWPNGNGYVGWHSAASSQAGAYGMQTNLGGQYGLWLWPVGGQSYSYTQGQYAEWTYTAPGTTRLSSAALVLSYKNKLLAHHCIDVGFRDATGAVVTHDEHCIPVQPPDSQRQVNISLVDPSTNPTSKVLYFRIRVDCGGATTCSKNIPALDPLSTGGYARLLSADMTLVDDDQPNVFVDGELTQQVYVNGSRAYGLIVSASDAGSGVQRAWAELGNGTVVASGNAPCDPTHNTPELDNRICPASWDFVTSVDTSPFPEGRNDVIGKASDVAANVGNSSPFSVLVDRTAPPAADTISVWNYDTTLHQATIGWDTGSDPDLPTGEPGSGISRAEYRTQVNGGGWSAWTPSDATDAGTFTPAFSVGANPGDTVDVEVHQWDDVDNASTTGTAHLTVAGTEQYDDAGISEEDGAPDEGTVDAGLGRDPNYSQPPLLDDPTGTTVAAFSSVHTLVAHRAADFPDPCGSRTGGGSNDSITWDVYAGCIVFTNNGGDKWTIYKKCVNNPNTNPRQDTGPGYIGKVVDREGDTIVNDFRVRGSNDAGIWNVGNIGATNGGLGNFELQYARGPVGNMHDAGWNFVNDPPAQLARTIKAPFDGILTSRACASKYGGYGVTKSRFKGPWKVGSNEDFAAQVWFRDPSTSTDPTDSTALLKVTYHYRFTATRVFAILTLRVNEDHGDGGSSFAKEPKWGASVRADGLFNEIEVFDSSGHQVMVKNGTKWAWAAYRGQREAPQGVLYTSQADNNTRVRVRWACTAVVCGGKCTTPACGATTDGRCPKVCFDVDMRSLDVSALKMKNPFAAATHLWESQTKTPRGLDGWAYRSKDRPLGYPNDTTGDNSVTTCSAGAGPGFQGPWYTNRDANGNLIPGYFATNPPTPATAGDIRAVAKKSANATPWSQPERRWELLGWKQNVPPGTTDLTTWFDNYFTGSAVLFNGWEGARGPYDCEPLMREFPAVPRTYVNRAVYWIEH